MIILAMPAPVGSLQLAAIQFPGTGRIPLLPKQIIETLESTGIDGVRHRALRRTYPVIDFVALIPSASYYRACQDADKIESQVGGECALSVDGQPGLTSDGFRLVAATAEASATQVAGWTPTLDLSVLPTATPPATIVLTGQFQRFRPSTFSASL